MITRKAQTLLEYSLLIAVTVASLLFIQAYVRRNLQGFLKQHADNLGGEKVTPERFTPGRFFGASQSTVARNWAFEYEGRKGFGVTIGGSRRTQLSKLIAPTSTKDIPSKAPVYETQFDGKDTALMENIESSSFKPQRERLDEEIERDSEQGKWKNTESPEMDEGTGDDIDSQAENLVEEYVNRGKEGRDTPQVEYID